MFIEHSFLQRFAFKQLPPEDQDVWGAKRFYQRKLPADVVLLVINSFNNFGVFEDHIVTINGLPIDPSPDHLAIFIQILQSCKR